MRTQPGRLLVVSTVSLFFSLHFATHTSAAEKWADSRLKVTKGLELWLDTGSQHAARQALKQPPLKDTAPVDCWYDASGHERHATQKNAEAQPQFLTVADAALMRFDGLNDHLRCTGLNQSLDAFTVFLVAAPHTNLGGFRAFMAINAKDKRDYESGFNIDMSFLATWKFETLNIEGKGFGGAVDLLALSYPLGTAHILESSADPEEKVLKLSVDGKFAGKRPFTPGKLGMDEITIGARYFNNGPGPQTVQGFLHGDIMEVLLYGRVLSADETQSVRDYLEKKYAKLKKALPGTLKGLAQPPETVDNPPAVQMLAPGFAVRQLPIDLPNINNLKYRADGKLMALAYNGNVYRLSDTDNDGLEDRADLFWDAQGKTLGPIGMDLTPPGYKHGAGVFVASKGKLALLVDTDGDDTADKEIVIASGWKPLPHGVDALGVAFDQKTGAIYFGLGTTDYANAYLLNKGKAGYDIKSERGTILKVSADFSKREIFSTGIRFPVGLTFNRFGDLFCSDQEGATWLPNGNPFDELLHLEKGKHYGFPPRHPVHLPGVIDEPSLFDYRPQHQSTCGLCFNESVKDRLSFGPAFWSDSALMAGYSRGKLYRTKLAKTKHGYVAQNHLMACLNMLTVESCIAPGGDLVVAVHSGGPDWGTGPQGKGKLYKVNWHDRAQPQPVAIWPASPYEVHVAFDRPLDPKFLKDLIKQTKISYGKYVGAGDRFEVHRPGYAVVQMELMTPRFELPVLAAQVSADLRTLMLTTGIHPEALRYAVTFPPLAKPSVARHKGELPQHAAIDLAYDLCGVAASWQPKAGPAQWNGWLPHLNLDASRAFTTASATHDRLWKLLAGEGKLVLDTKLNLFHMLRPAVQPGSQLDHAWPDETVTVVFQSSVPLQLASATGKIKTMQLATGRHEVRWTVQPVDGKPLAMQLTLSTGAKTPDLDVWFVTNEDDRPRALPLHRFLLPWAVLKKSTDKLVVQLPPELNGGNWARGKEIFFGDKSGCARCHALHGQGSKIGPDLSNLIHRDYASVLRDITQPSYAINPDYVSYLVQLKSGKFLSGTLRSEGKKLLIGGDQGLTTAIDADDVDTLAPSPVSLMPTGIAESLGAGDMRDLLMFLLTKQP